MNRLKNGHIGHVRHTCGKTAKAMSACCIMVCMAITCALVPVAGAQDAASQPADASAVQDSQEGGITLEYQYQGASVEGAEVKLYRVADWNGKGTFSLDSAFSGVSYDWDGLMKELEDSRNGGSVNASDFQTAATTLEAYAQAQHIAPVNEGVVYASGATFNGLDNGLYLISIDRYADAQKICGSSASLVSLPFNDGQNLVPQVTLRAKNVCEPVPVNPTTTTLTVAKVWKDDDTRTRPESITVTLLRDGTPSGSVTLNAANGWKHVWNGLDASHDWTAVEHAVPKGYTVAIERDADTLTITNTGSGTPSGSGMAKTGVATMPMVLAVMAVALLALPVAIRAKRK